MLSCAVPMCAMSMVPAGSARHARWRRNAWARASEEGQARPAEFTRALDCTARLSADYVAGARAELLRHGSGQQARAQHAFARSKRQGRHHNHATAGCLRCANLSRRPRFALWPSLTDRHVVRSSLKLDTARFGARPHSLLTPSPLSRSLCVTDHAGPDSASLPERRVCRRVHSRAGSGNRVEWGCRAVDVWWGRRGGGRSATFVRPEHARRIVPPMPPAIIR